MISSVSGELSFIGPGYAVLEAGGIGYQIFAPARALLGARVGEAMKLFTRMVVRDDSMTLYGFAERDEIEIFDHLTTVPGVGPKSAVSVLSELAPSEIRAALVSGDEKVFQRVSGIGPKTARLIVATLSDRIDTQSARAQTPEVFERNPSLAGQLVQALTGLGWSEKEAVTAVERLVSAGHMREESSLQELLKLALTRVGGV